jgi:hypothetical protein
MADKIIQDVELDDNEDVVEAHDPKNAEKQSIAATNAAAGATKRAPQLKGSKVNGEAMPKSKAGMISAAHDLMSEMTAEDIANVLNMLMGADAAEAASNVAEARKVDINIDFTADLNALVESEATLSEEFKAKTAVIFEAAIKSKLSEEIDRLEEAYATELEEEVKTIKSDLVEKVDSYLNYVVETWMEENRLAVQAGLRTEIAETFMNKLKDLFVESYVEVPESKVDLVDELANANEELEEQLNGAVAKSIKLAEELEGYKRDAIIREAAGDLAATQVEKLKSLVEDIDFDDEKSFAQKVKTIKESYFKKKTAEATFVEDDASDDTITEEVSSTMAQYLKAIRKSH